MPIPKTPMRCIFWASCERNRERGRGDCSNPPALDANPRYADAWNNLGLLLRAMPHYSAALEAFDKAAEYGPHLLVAHLNRAKLLRRRGQLDESAAAFRRVLELDPALHGCPPRLGQSALSHGPFR